MVDTNIALLANLGWAMASNLDVKWVQILKAKYLRRKSFLKAPLSFHSFWLWKGICKSKALVKKRAFFQVHSGFGINIWEDPWIPSQLNFTATGIGALPNYKHWVFQLKTQSNSAWDINILNELFDSITIRNIL